MSRPEFLWVESPGTSKRIEPHVLSTKFGDGYEQASQSGLHSDHEVWTYQATDIDSAIADEIEAFLRDGMGWKRFDWKPPRNAAALVFKCTALSRTLGSTAQTESITATFEQVWEA